LPPLIWHDFEEALKRNQNLSLKLGRLELVGQPSGCLCIFESPASS
jgi:hypothetical protein